MKFAAGFILVVRHRKTDSKLAFLVLQAHNHKTWVPVKGYVDDDESLQDAAIRELGEETGLNVSQLHVYWDISFVTNYRAWGDDKQVTYFLSVVDTEPEITISDEHIGFKWVTAEEYRELQPNLTGMHGILFEAKTVVQSQEDNA